MKIEYSPFRQLKIRKLRTVKLSTSDNCLKEKEKRNNRSVHLAYDHDAE